MTRTDAETPAADRGPATFTTVTLTHRARRAAALRMPPIGDGPADPLDDIRGQPISKPHRCFGVEFTGGGKVKPCCGREKVSREPRQR